MCNVCFSDDKIETKTTFTVEYNDCIIVIKKCSVFGMSKMRRDIFSDEVSEKLERLTDAAKKIMQEISVIDYSKAA